jgi:Flp pilus assembly protein TadD
LPAAFFGRCGDDRGVPVSLDFRSTIGRPFAAPHPTMPTNSELYDAAVKLKDEGNLQGAVDTLFEVLKQEPNYALAHGALSIYLGRLQRHEEAVAHARKVCELEPNDPRSFSTLSVVAQRAGRIQEAEEAMARGRMIAGHH